MSFEGPSYDISPFLSPLFSLYMTHLSQVSAIVVTLQDSIDY